MKKNIPGNDGVTNEAISHHRASCHNHDAGHGPTTLGRRQFLAAGLGFAATAPLLMREAIGAEVGQPSAPANKNRITARAYGAAGRPLGHAPVADPAPAVPGTANVQKELIGRER